MRLGDGKKAGIKSYREAAVRQANHEKNQSDEEPCRNCHENPCRCDKGEKL